MQAYDWWPDAVKVAFTYGQWYRIKEIALKKLIFINCSQPVTYVCSTILVQYIIIISLKVFLK